MEDQETMIQPNSQISQVCFDKTLPGIDPQTVHKVRLSSGVTMPVAAFGTFHSDWAQDYMKDATVEAIRLGWRHLDTARATRTKPWWARPFARRSGRATSPRPTS